jgi:hypothetical protein
MRDELLGIGQRAALVEDTVAKLSDPDATAHRHCAWTRPNCY